jgi:hypothetical protein
LSGKIDRGSARSAAFNNVVASIDVMAVLPQQIFLGKMTNCLFFESDRVFAASFAKIVGDLMLAERATSCCLLRIPQTNVIESGTTNAIFLDAGAKTGEYESQLRSGGPATGWLFSMGRYACASDEGEWCIYCERHNDVAVIGLRSHAATEKFTMPLRKLHASAIENLVRSNSFASVPFNRLTERWRNALVENYGNRPLR